MDLTDYEFYDDDSDDDDAGFGGAKFSVPVGPSASVGFVVA